MTQYEIAPVKGEESVYNLLERHTPPKQRAKRHRSRHNPTAPPTASTFGLKNTTIPGVSNMSGDQWHDARNDSTTAGHPIRRDASQMGRSVRESIRTDEFLRRGNGLGGTAARGLEPHLTKKAYSGRPLAHMKKPNVPHRTEKPIMGLTTQKNFITANAVENILSVPKKVPSQQTRYTEKNEYGEVPQYLKSIKQEIQQEYEYIRELQQTNSKRGKQLELLPEEDRLNILEALKSKWHELNQKYQSMSFSVPVSKGPQPVLDKTKVARKEILEQQLETLEKDIEKFSKKNVFVHNGYNHMQQL